jgi:hypothetical protein
MEFLYGEKDMCYLGSPDYKKFDTCVKSLFAGKKLTVTITREYNRFLIVVRGECPESCVSLCHHFSNGISLVYKYTNGIAEKL